MKNSLALLLLVFLTLGGSMNAQQRGMKTEQQKSDMLDKMKERLSLTDQQVVQIKAIDAKYQNQEQDYKNQMTQLREQHANLRTQKKAEIDKVLTVEQRNKITEWRNENRKGRKSEMRMNKDGRKSDMKQKGIQRGNQERTGQQRRMHN